MRCIYTQNIFLQRAAFNFKIFLSFWLCIHEDFVEEANHYRDRLCEKCQRGITILYGSKRQTMNMEKRNITDKTQGLFYTSLGECLLKYHHMLAACFPLAP